MRVTASTSAFRDGRSTPVSGSMMRGPQPSLVQYVAPSPTAMSHDGSRAPRVNLRGALAIASSTSSGAKRATRVFGSTRAPFSASTAKALAERKRTPTSSRMSSVACLSRSSCSGV